MTEEQPRVFIVDDDDSMARALARLMKAVDLAVETFPSAHGFLEREPYDGPCCLVLDVRMPGISGTQLQARLVKAGITIPVIFVTGHGDVPMAVKAMKAGAFEFLLKPVNDQVLIDTVQQAIDHDREARRRAGEAAEAHELIESLTPREREVLDLIAQGLLNKQIGGKLGASESTIKVHRSRLMKKTGASSVAALLTLLGKATGVSESST